MGGEVQRCGGAQRYSCDGIMAPHSCVVDKNWEGYQGRDTMGE